MTDTSPPLVPDDEQSRGRLRALLVLCCVAAVVLAGTVVPAISSGGLGDSPLGSVVPQPGVDPYQGAPGAGGGAGAGGALGDLGGLGALNPGDRTSVGGSLADDEESSAFRSQNAETHFTVRSSSPAYWRTGAYDTYTGSGWERTGGREPYAGPLDGDGMADRRVEYRVRLNQSATALPTVWRPESVSGPDSLLVTDRRAFVTEKALPAGTSYGGVSHRPPRDEAVLQTAGRDYPAEVEDRYTDLPANTDRRLGDFTANLTADADTPYETATRVEAWLEANKEYSLNVTEPEDDVASQFVFEMDEGYCEYFATAMTAMLRSQGVPARYVVGYSTGQMVEPDTYEVRGMNAHAWVEVYFPEVGWVRFDPTPGSDRLEAEQEAFENQTDDPEAEYDPVEEGSPDETFSADDSDARPPEDGSDGTATSDDPATDGSDETTAPPTGTTDGDAPTETPGEGTAGEGTTADGSDAGTTTGDSDDSEGDDSGDFSDSDNSDDPTDSPLGGYDVELNRTPVPGATVTATVTRDGSPAADVAVLFNGERIGTTDDAGQVAGGVPYARNLTITVRDDAQAAAIGDPSVVLGGSPSAFGGFTLASDALASLASPPPSLLQAGNETNDSRSYSLETNATVAVSGDRVTGNEVVVTATVEDVALRNAEVRLDGEPVAETDRKGRAEIRLPDSPGDATVSVGRGPVAGETTVSLPELNVTVEPSLPLALPGTKAEVSATYEGEPVSGADVTLGDAEATTDIDGTATVALPFRRSATAVVSVHGQTRSETVSGLLLNLFGVLAGAAVVVGGVGFGAYRRGATPRRVGRVLLAAIAALPRLAVAALFGVVDAIERGIQAILDAVRDLLDGRTTPRELFDRLRDWFRERLLAVRARARWSLDELGEGPASDADGTRRVETDDSYRTLREAWRDFLLVVSVRTPGAMTPGELAAHAVREDGLPADAVATLRDAFRDVEYGARSPSERLPGVEDALAAIEDATRGPDDEPNSRGAESESVEGEQ